ncbi:hypothetical protein CHS0354_030509 [Potamilus streckersoni]|uniref:Uncharacterized protein n=1 Tax=Potamilus streckersoni TaxID=2493646 RepID=A0AAE0VGX7_9BIVA|nr:hypothetical protein CHS0354_030509 [Potamilus streckersoni]
MASKKNDAHNNSGSELSCGICSKSFEDPRILNCFHVFCFECLNGYVNKNSWKKSLLCPLCQKETGIPKDGIKYIQEDFFVRAKLASGKLKLTSECEKCSNYNFAKCRCLECDVNMCEGCKLKHTESENERLHHFLEFLNMPPDPKAVPGSRPSMQLSYLSFCTKHNGQRVSMYCKTCNIGICDICKGSSHKEHPVEDATEVSKIMRDLLAPFVGTVKEYLPEFEDYYKKIKQRKGELDSDLCNAIKDIESRSRFLQKEIEKISKALITEVKERHKNEVEKIDVHLKKVAKSYQSMSSITVSAERIISYASNDTILETSVKIQKRFLQLEDELPTADQEKIETVGFVPGGLKALGLSAMFGQCTKGDLNLPKVPIPWGLRVARQFEIRSISGFKCKEVPETIQAIAPISEKEAWVCCGWGAKEVHLFSREGQKIKTVGLDIQVDHMCVTPDGEVLVSSYEDKYIKKIDKNHNVVDFSNPHLYPGGMTMNRRKELYVCAVDSYTTRRTEHSHRVLMKMTQYGFPVDEIDDDGQKPIFGAPYRVAENVNRDLVVTDREDNKLRVMLVDMEGRLKDTYIGPKDIKLKQPFNPLGVCCDKHGNILISDWGNHCVHLLDMDSQFVGFILSRKDGLFKPNAIALDTGGNLWVGDGNATVRVFNYAKRPEN